MFSCFGWHGCPLLSHHHTHTSELCLEPATPCRAGFIVTHPSRHSPPAPSAAACSPPRALLFLHAVLPDLVPQESSIPLPCAARRRGVPKLEAHGGRGNHGGAGAFAQDWQTQTIVQYLWRAVHTAVPKKDNNSGADAAAAKVDVGWFYLRPSFLRPCVDASAISC